MRTGYLGIVSFYETRKTEFIFENMQQQKIVTRNMREYAAERRHYEHKRCGAHAEDMLHNPVRKKEIDNEAALSAVAQNGIGLAAHTFGKILRFQHTRTAAEAQNPS